MNYFNLLRELREEGYAVSLYCDYLETWCCSVYCTSNQVTVDISKPSPEEAIRLAYLAVNTKYLVKSGAV